MADLDADLATALKQAKGKKMFFAFIPKGSDGKLIVTKAKVPAKQIADAKKEIGGGNAVIGKCFGEGNTMVFQVAKAAPASLGPALKKVAKRDAGLSIEPDVQVAGDADADEAETGAAAAGAAAPAGGAPGAAPAAAPAPGAAQNLGPWQTARQTAIKDLKALAGKVAATKHGSAAGVLKEIQSIITRLPANPASNEIDKLEAFIRTDDTITAAEEVPGHFHDLDIREPLLKALEGLKQ